MSQPKPGDRFSFIYLDEEDSQPREAIVQRILSNRDEGLSSPEADFYVAEWLEALPLNPSDLDPTPADPTQPFTMMLSADCKTFIDGRLVSVTFDCAPS
jgi:hypothetical protein